jgi:hypothetical protein
MNCKVLRHRTCAFLGAHNNCRGSTTPCVFVHKGRWGCMLQWMDFTTTQTAAPSSASKCRPHARGAMVRASPPINSDELVLRCTINTEGCGHRGVRAVPLASAVVSNVDHPTTRVYVMVIVFCRSRLSCTHANMSSVHLAWMAIDSGYHYLTKSSGASTLYHTNI